MYVQKKRRHYEHTYIYNGDKNQENVVCAAKGAGGDQEDGRKMFQDLSSHAPAVTTRTCLLII